MRKQKRIQSGHGSIGPVRRANAGRGGAGRGGEKTGEPEEAASAGGAGGSTAQVSRVFDLCDLTRLVKNPRSMTQAQRRKGKAKKERAEWEEEGRAPL